MIRKAMLLGWVTALLALGGSGCCVNPMGCGPGPCDPCGGGPFGGHLRNALTCHSGCGEIYVDEWLSDPPHCCDPCNSCGDWIGPQYCGVRPFRGLLGLIVGQRYYSDGCSPCDPCGVGGAGHVPHGGCTGCGHPMHGEVFDSHEHIQPQPTPPPTPPQPPRSLSTQRRYERPYYSHGPAARPASHAPR